MSLYQKIILDYARDKSNNKKIDGIESRGHNATCGDDITLILKFDDDDICIDASFVGSGCAISIASTNMLISLIKNKKLNEIKNILIEFFALLNNEEADEEILEDIIILKDAMNMPARVKCVTLVWHSLEEIINKLESKKNEEI